MNVPAIIKPTRYVLTYRGDHIVLLLHADEGVPEEGSAIEAVRRINGRSLPGLRRNGARMAKRNGCPFVDETA